jgi:hypothetical protein
MNEVFSQQCKEFIVACWIVNVRLYVLLFLFEDISCSEEEIGLRAVVLAQDRAVLISVALHSINIFMYIENC